MPNNDFSKKSQLVYSIEFFENKNVATSVTIPANSKAHVQLDVTTNNSITENSENVKGNGENISDERKSVKRSYNPMDDVDDEGNKWERTENDGVKIIFSVPDFDNPVYEYKYAPQELEPEVLETYNALVVSSDDSDLRKRLADFTKAKKYARKEAIAEIDAIITERGCFDGLDVKFKGKSRTQIERMLWNALNSADEGARKGRRLILYIVTDLTAAILC